MLRRYKMIQSALLLVSVCILGAENKYIGGSVRFCCESNEEVSSSGECVPILNMTIVRNPQLNVTLLNGTIVEKNMSTYFKSDIGKPCEYPFVLDNKNNPKDGWKLFENGTFYRLYDNKNFSENEYCLQYYLEDETYVIKPYNCPIKNEVYKMKSYLMRISIGCMVLTAVIYMVVPKLRNLFGKCFISMLTAHTACYAILDSQVHYVYSSMLCQLIGYLGYFFSMAIFLWLLVTMYDLWSHAGLQKKQKESSARFVVYSVFVWSIAAIFTCIIFLVDKSNFANSLSPNVGVYFCWINTEDYWTSVVYLYGPMSILMIFIVLLLALTANKIKIMNMATQQFSRLDNFNELGPNRLNSSLIIRLAVVIYMWDLELLQFYINKESVNQVVILIYTMSEAINAAQGIILFVLFVLNPTVMKTTTDWIQEKRTMGEANKRSIRAQYLTQNSLSSEKNLL